MNRRSKGITLVILAAVFWGVSGTVAQFLLQKGFTVEWLVSVRLLASGMMLLTFAAVKEKQNIWEIWKYRWDALQILLFSIAGMLAVQYTYFAAIHHSNAATATVLQYLAPSMIATYLTLRLRRVPHIYEVLAIILALIGTFLLVTKGNIGSLSISGWALFWGIASAVALAFYTLHPHKLLARWGSTIVVGWGMLVGGLSFSLFQPPWSFTGELTLISIGSVFFIVLFGTLFAFYFYLDSLKYISPSESSLLVCVEPLSAAFLAVIWLKVTFGWFEWIGTFLILSAVIILSLTEKEDEDEGGETLEEAQY